MSTIRKVKKEVMNRLDEIQDKAVKGDKKSLQALSKLNEPGAMEQLVEKTINNPRVKKAAKKGAMIGAAVPLIAGGALIAKGIHKNKKYKKAKEQYDKDIKAWRERNKK